MITKNKIIYDLLSILRGGILSDDEQITTSQVSFWIDNIRSILIRQQYTKGQSINSDIIQTIDCLDIEEIDASLCPCEIIGCNILRSKKQIPVTVETEFKNLITRVSTPFIKGVTFSHIPFSRVPYVNSMKFGKKIIKWFIHNRFIYLISKDVLIDKISLSGVFQYPEDLKDFVNCSDQSCYTDDSYYPISNHMIEVMKKMIIDLNGKIVLSTFGDNINNAKNDIINDNSKR